MNDTPTTEAGRRLADEASEMWRQPDHLAGVHTMRSATADIRRAILAIEAEARTDPTPRLVRVEIGVIEGWSDKPSARLSETAEMEAYFADVPRVGDYIDTAYGAHRVKTVFWMLDGSSPLLRLDTTYTGEDSMDTALAALRQADHE